MTNHEISRMNNNNSINSNTIKSTNNNNNNNNNNINVGLLSSVRNNLVFQRRQLTRRLGAFWKQQQQQQQHDGIATDEESISVEGNNNNYNETEQDSATAWLQQRQRQKLQQERKELEELYKSIALLERYEVCVDQYIATGSFCDVFQVSGFELDVENDNNNDNNNNDDVSDNHHSAARQELLKLSQDGHCKQQYQNHPHQPQHRFVIKNVRRSLQEDPKRLEEAVQSLVLEAKLLIQCNHENIIPIRGCSKSILDASKNKTRKMIDCNNNNNCKNDASFFIILDRVHSTLTDRIDQWKRQRHHTYYATTNTNDDHSSAYQHFAPWIREPIQYSLEIANALEYLHRHRMIYRDLKPQNIGLTRDNHIQLFDFGLCRELPTLSSGFYYHNSSTFNSRYHSRSSLKNSNNNNSNHVNDTEGELLFHMTCAGTRRYMAPEVLLRTGYNTKADVYSWAMVFYEMLSLKRPYEEYNRDLHFLFVGQEGRRPPIPNISNSSNSYNSWPRDVVDLLRISWSQSISTRWEMSDVVREISRWLQHGTTTTATTRKMNETTVQESKNSIWRDTPVTASTTTTTTTTRTSILAWKKQQEEEEEESGLVLTDCSSFSQESSSDVPDHHSLSSLSTVATNEDSTDTTTCGGGGNKSNNVSNTITSSTTNTTSKKGNGENGPLFHHGFETVEL